ncbi:MAG TPA: HAD family hydrolase [Actinomycetota bacterium]|nr:HAD family hydrolase [Actinomycetota bacterium]
MFPGIPHSRATRAVEGALARSNFNSCSTSGNSGFILTRYFGRCIPAVRPGRGDVERREGNFAAAFFDLDRTLVPGASMFWLVRAMVDEGFVPIAKALQLAVGHVRYRATKKERLATITNARNSSLRAIRGKDVAELSKIAERVAMSELAPRVYPRMAGLIDAHKQAGHLTYLVTASTQELARPLAGALGFHAALATHAEVIDGVYTGRLNGVLNHGMAKAERVSKLARALHIDLSRSTAYSDSISDLPLLELVSTPVAVHPDKALRSIARSRGWLVIDPRGDDPISAHEITSTRHLTSSSL